jgi:hypothetical protein
MGKIAFSVLLGSLAFAGSAQAQSGYPDEYALRPVQLPESMLQLHVPVVFNIAPGSFGDYVAIPLDIRVGLSHELELRLFHPVNGLCLRGCGKKYNDLALGLLYALMRDSNSQLSLLGALEVTSFASPATLRLDVGVAYKYFQGAWSIGTTPYLGVGLNHRDWNGDGINIPVEFAYQLSHPMALFAVSGLYGSTKHFGDDWHMPLGFGLNYLVQHAFDLGAEIVLNNAIGNGDSDNSTFIVYASWRNQ